MGTNRGTVERANGESGKSGTGNPNPTNPRDPGERTPITPTPSGKPASGTGANPGAGPGTPNANNQPAGGTGEKRKHRASKENAKNKGAQTQIDVEAPPVLEGIGEAPAAKPSGKGRGRPPKQPKIDGKQAARGLMEMVEVFTVATFGYEAAFSPTERFMIEDPLTRVIEKYGAAVGQYSGLVDPIMLLAGLGMYAVRMDALYNDRRAKEKEAKQYEAEAQRRKSQQPGPTDQFTPEGQPIPDQPFDPLMTQSNKGDPSNPNGKVVSDIAFFTGGVHRDR